MNRQDKGPGPDTGSFFDLLATELSLETTVIQKIRVAWEKDRTGLIKAALATRQVEEDTLLAALGKIYRIPLAHSLDAEKASDGWTRRISRRFLAKKHMVPLVSTGHGKSMIAVNDPSDLAPADDLAALIPMKGCDLVLATRETISSAISILYERSSDTASQLVEDLDENEYVIPEDGQAADLLDDSADAPVIRLVNRMISQAVKAGASDIHIEPFQDSLKIRYRIDGLLYERLTPPKGLQASLISRIKVMANMNIAEKRVPQDGRAQVRIGGQEIDIRISTVPTGFGERLVMRLLNKSGYFLSFNEFGMAEQTLAKLRRIIRQTNGIVLVTGPTGSGKTTTLYAGLSEINSPEKSIITIEDPVEYNLTGIGQIQVNPKTGVTFAKGLRSIVRQDPDVILVGEIRDMETASIAIQSALTGHLVFSTLHTNDAAGAVTRLADLGVEPYLIASSVHTVIAQRLVRVLCRRCRQKHTLTRTDVQQLGPAYAHLVGQEVFQPIGCDHCFDTGYSGRQAIFEILELTDDLKQLILTTSDANQIRKAAVAKGMMNLSGDGMAKVLQGITSIREVLRVTQD